MNSFYLAHINQSSDLREVFLQEPVWKTCLRTIVCFDESILESVLSRSAHHNLNLRILKDSEAYQYLLEVICGLKSDIIGETQVLGQFKIFLSELEKNHKLYYLNHYSLFQSLLQDCKELREKHIHHWGGSSYGSLTRKIVESNENVFILGNGQLAQSLTPWIKQKKVFIFGRTPKNNDQHVLTAENLKKILSVNTKPTALVIAAPLENQFLRTLLSLGQFEKIIDWRGETQIEACDLSESSEYHSFKHLADFMQSEKLKKQKHLEVLGEIIKQKITSWSERKILRPKGWDDLC